MTKFLSVEDIIEMHDLEIRCPVISADNLNSAVGQPSASWGGEPLYPTLLEQAAALLFCLCNAHAFADGNKRVAWLACTTFLDVNGVELLEIVSDEIVSFMVDVAAEDLDIPTITRWLVERV